MSGGSFILATILQPGKPVSQEEGKKPQWAFMELKCKHNLYIDLLRADRRHTEASDCHCPQDTFRLPQRQETDGP